MRSTMTSTRWRRRQKEEEKGREAEEKLDGEEQQ